MRNPSDRIRNANRARASAASTSRCRVDARELQPLHAQNFLSRAHQVNDATAAATVPNGGYRTRRERLLVTVCNLTPVSG
jgi:ribosomal protein S8